MSNTARRGWLTAAIIAICAALTLVAVITAVTVVRALNGAAFSFGIPTATVGIPQAPAGLEPGVTIDPSGFVDVTVAQPTTAQAAWSLVASLPVLLAAAGLVLVLVIALRARRGEPFTRNVVALVRTIGLVVLVGGPLMQAVTGVARSRLAESVLVEGGHYGPTITLDWVIAGLCILALAEVIRHGKSLREELDEVI